MAAVDKTKTNPIVSPDVGTVVPPGDQTVHVPGADSPGVDAFRSGSPGAPDAGFSRRTGGLWRADPASRELNIPGVGRMTVGEALTRLAPDELPNFSENNAMMTEALRAAIS